MIFAHQYYSINKMHLVDITLFYAPESGGVKTYLMAKAKWLARFPRIQHSIVVPRVKDESYGYGVIGIPSMPVPFMHGYRMPRSIKHAGSILERLQPDCVEVGDPFQFAWAALDAKRRISVPIVAFYHSDLPQSFRLRFGKLAEKMALKYLSNLYRQFDLVLAPSEGLAQKLRNIGIHRARHQPLGVDTSLFSPAWRDGELRARLALPQNARLLIYAGRLAKEKNLPLLISAVEKLGPPYHLLIVGGGTTIPSSKHVSCIHFQQDARTLAALMASCDVLVHPGPQETFGLVVLEAMACGLPVVGMASGGVAELVDDKTGILVAPGSADELAQGIRHVYRKGTAELGMNARRKVIQLYDWNHIMPQLMSHYVSLIASKGKRAPLPSSETSYVSH